jgi:pimeloyl-ACP methyl ester carboxylesterase
MLPRFSMITVPATSLIPRPSALATDHWPGPQNTTRRPVVCLHALTRQRHDFYPLAQDLAQHTNVYAFDTVGRGHSDWLKDPVGYNYSSYVDHTLAWCDQLGLASIDLVGSSMGGLIGLAVARARPGLIHSLVLNDIGPWLPGESLERVAKYVGLMPVFPTMDGIMAHIQKIFATFKIKDPQYYAFMASHSVRRLPEGGWTLHYDPAISQQQLGCLTDRPWTLGSDLDLWPLWHAATPSIPRLLVLRGMQSDILHAETVEQMKQSHPQATSITWPEVGHIPALMELYQRGPVVEWLLEPS